MANGDAEKFGVRSSKTEKMKNMGVRSSKILTAGRIRGQVFEAGEYGARSSKDLDIDPIFD